MLRCIRANFEKNNEASLEIFWTNCFWQNIKVQYPLNLPDLATCNFFLFLNWRFISQVRFDNMKGIERNMMEQPHTISKDELQKYFTKWETAEKICWIPRGLFWKKFIFYLLFISVSVHAASVLILFFSTLHRVWSKRGQKHVNNFCTFWTYLMWKIAS